MGIAQSAGSAEESEPPRLVGAVEPVRNRPFQIGPLSDGQWSVWGMGTNTSTDEPDGIESNKRGAELVAMAKDVAAVINRAG
ncbi:hypothetical protein AB0K60_23060 [Thermopolyspora sp. NPDC052614]|uniref:hypothetical protein n=1 Tax=Thermopolyspora sp. NPDC052614 TaxID=3155682 RepID=UPI0034122E18